MRAPWSRASWMMRLIGAESGATMAMMRLAATMFPKPMLISRGSLNILDLLAHALELALHRDDRPGDLEVVGLRAGGVDLAAHLLQDELQPAAHRAIGVQELLAKLGDGAAQPRHLLHVADAPR